MQCLYDRVAVTVMELRPALPTFGYGMLAASALDFPQVTATMAFQVEKHL